MARFNPNGKGVREATETTNTMRNTAIESVRSFEEVFHISQLQLLFYSHFTVA